MRGFLVVIPIGGLSGSWQVRLTSAAEPPFRHSCCHNFRKFAKTVGLNRRAHLCYTRDMTIKRLEHVSVVVDDLAAAIAFFIALGMTLEGEMPVEGPWVDRVNGLEVFKSTS